MSPPIEYCTKHHDIMQLDPKLVRDYSAVGTNCMSSSSSSSSTGTPSQPEVKESNDQVFLRIIQSIIKPSLVIRKACQEELKRATTRYNILLADWNKVTATETATDKVSRGIVLHQAREEVEELRKTVETTSGLQKSLRDRVAGLLKSIELQEMKITEHATTLHNTESQVERCRQEIDKQNAAKQVVVKKVQSDQSDLKRLTTEHQTALDKIKELKTKIDLAQKELSKQRKELSEHAGEMSALKIQIQQRKELLTGLASELSICDEKIKHDKADRTIQIGKRAAIRTEISELQNQIQSLEAKLNGDRQDALLKEKELPLETAKFSKLYERFRQAQQNIVDIEDALKASQEWKIELTSQLAAQNNQNVELEREIEMKKSKGN